MNFNHQFKERVGKCSSAKASTAVSAVVLFTGYLFSVPLSLLIGYIVIATTFVLVGLRCSLREYRRSFPDVIASESCTLNPYEPPASA